MAGYVKESNYNELAATAGSIIAEQKQSILDLRAQLAASEKVRESAEREANRFESLYVGETVDRSRAEQDRNDLRNHVRDMVAAAERDTRDHDADAQRVSELTAQLAECVAENIRLVHSHEDDVFDLGKLRAVVEKEGQHGADCASKTDRV